MSDSTRFTQRRIRLRIPKPFHQEPVISQLVSNYQVTVNIMAAVLGANANGDGWFDLELRGNDEYVEQALDYANDLGLEVWRESEWDQRDGSSELLSKLPRVVDVLVTIPPESDHFR